MGLVAARSFCSVCQLVFIIAMQLQCCANAGISRSSMLKGLPTIITNRIGRGFSITKNRIGFHWLDRNGATNLSPDVPSNQLKIVSYNVLGPKHAEGLKHAYAPTTVTAWSNRKLKLMEELKQLDADILCLQEVTERSLRKTIMPKLAKANRNMICAGFAEAKDDRFTKPVDAAIAAVKSRKLSFMFDNHTLGCAVFCNANKVKLLDSRKVLLRDFFSLSSCRSLSLLDDFNQRPNSMVLLLVELIETGQVIVVANVHAFWDPARQDLKVLQALAITQAIHRFCEVSDLLTEKKPPIVLCGDFNFTPLVNPEEGTREEIPMQSMAEPEGISDTTIAANKNINTAGKSHLSYDSALFHLYCRGVLEPSHPEHPDRWFARVIPPSICPRLGPLRPPWILRNSFDSEDFARHAPVFTTKTDEFSGWIDHIFVNDRVSVTQVLLSPVCQSDADANVRAEAFSPIPDEDHASDHVPMGIIAEIRTPNDS